MFFTIILDTEITYLKFTARRNPQITTAINSSEGLPDVGYTGMCHRQGSTFHFQKSRTGVTFEIFSRTGPDFYNFTPEQDPFLTIWSQMSKMPVAFLKKDWSNPNFLSKTYACLSAKNTDCVPITIIVSKLYSNKLMLLPVGVPVSCSLMLTCSCKK